MEKNTEIWWRIFSDNFKVHTVPDSLKQSVVDNLKARSTPVETNFKIDKTSKTSLDAGGMISKYDEVMEFPVGGISCQIFAHHVEFFLRKLIEAPERLEFGKPYYKIHGWLGCLCLTPEQKEELIQEIQKRQDEASAIAEITNQEFNDSMTDLNKKEDFKVLFAKRPVKGIKKV
jgi:hypothetical protein